jgi:uncharacterized protein YicC (UPF0701 family)
MGGMKTRSQIRSLNQRLLALYAQLEDETSRKFPAARAQVEQEIARAKSELGQ